MSYIINFINPIAFIGCSIYWFLQCRKTEKLLTTIRYEHMLHVSEIKLERHLAFHELREQFERKRKEGL